jgi:hypothetical protein
VPASEASVWSYAPTRPVGRWCSSTGGSAAQAPGGRQGVSARRQRAACVVRRRRGAPGLVVDDDELVVAQVDPVDPSDRTRPSVRVDTVRSTPSGSSSGSSVAA